MINDTNEMQSRLVPGVGRMPYPAYRGNEPYIFISYAHLDQDKVFAEIKRFNEAGFHVWYDEGISPGNEWSEEIADALDRCSVFVIMFTPVSAPRENVQNEIEYAVDEGKPFLAIHLEKTELPKGLKLRIGRKQAILKYTMTEEEYEYKVFEAFARHGLKRGETKVPGLTPAAPSQTEPSVSFSQILSGMHPFGDYVPKGTAFITDGLGRERTAIGNSLIYKPYGKTEFRAHQGLVSMERSPNGYILRDASERETILKTHPGDELWFLPAEENKGIGLLDPEKIQINMVKNIRIDPDSTPERKIRYCDIRMEDGAFKTPREFLFFAVSENNGEPPVMKLGKDLKKYSSKSYANLLMMKKIAVTNVRKGNGPYNDRHSLDVTVQYPGDEAESFTIDDYFAVYAMGANGDIHQVKVEELKEIEIL